MANQPQRKRGGQRKLPQRGYELCVKWDRKGGREGDARGKRYGDICICQTDSLCYTAETNTPL